MHISRIPSTSSNPSGFFNQQTPPPPTPRPALTELPTAVSTADTVGFTEFFFFFTEFQSGSFTEFSLGAGGGGGPQVRRVYFGCGLAMRSVVNTHKKNNKGTQKKKEFLENGNRCCDHFTCATYRSIHCRPIRSILFFSAVFFCFRVTEQKTITWTTPGRIASTVSMNLDNRTGTLSSTAAVNDERTKDGAGGGARGPGPPPAPPPSTPE